MRTNVAVQRTPIATHEGGKATHTDAFHELKRSVLTCLLFEDNFYEKGSEIAARIASLVPKVEPTLVSVLAVEARDRMNLRHVPLFLVSELSKIPGTGPLVEATLSHVIQRADELNEFVSIYWQYGARSGKPGKHPLSAGIKRGLAAAFQKFDRYRLGKYANREAAIKLRDVMFLVSPKPKNEEQAAVWKALASNTLATPDTWETMLSAAGKSPKKETWERVIDLWITGEGEERKVQNHFAILRNLRNIHQAGVSPEHFGKLRDAFQDGSWLRSRLFPYRFVVAAKQVPALEDMIEKAMFTTLNGLDPLPGNTGFLIDVSGSMDYALSTRGDSRTVFQSSSIAKPEETSRIDVAAGLAILLREKAPETVIATFSEGVVEVPPRRGFALRDAIKQSQPHSSTMLAQAINTLRGHFGWKGIDRLIVITDEQSQEGIANPWVDKSYVINVAPYQNGVSYRNGWKHIDGWSERCVEFIREFEALEEVA